MNKSIFTLLFFVSTSFMFSQSKTEFHKISLKNKNDIPIESNFYVENVYDARQYKENIGVVQMGAFNSKVLPI